MQDFSNKGLMRVNKGFFSPLELSLCNSNYLVGRNYLAVHEECIFSFSYKRSKKFEVPHYDFKKMFVIGKNFLEVSARCELKGGPPGDRCKIDVNFNDEIKCNFTSARTSMGEGTSGDYPYIKTDFGHIVFSIQVSPSISGNTASIDFYKDLEIIPEEYKNGNKNFFINKDYYTLEEIEHHKIVCWRCPIINEPDSGNYSGLLCFCEYPGFNECSYLVTGSFSSKERLLVPRRIERTESNQYLQTLEFISSSKDIIDKIIISQNEIKSIHKDEYLKNPF